MLPLKKKRGDIAGVPLNSTSGLRIWLKSLLSSHDLVLIPGPGTSICCGCGKEKECKVFYILYYYYYYYLLFRAAPAAYGSSQIRGQIRAAAAGLYHSHSNARSELHLGPTPQPTVMLDPRLTVRDWTCVLMDTSWVHYRFAIMGTHSFLFLMFCLFVCLFVCLFFFFFFGCPVAHGVPRPGIRSERSWDLSHSCGNTGSLTYYARWVIEPVSQCSQDAPDPVVPQGELMIILKSDESCE